MEFLAKAFKRRQRTNPTCAPHPQLRPRTTLRDTQSLTFSRSRPVTSTWQLISPERVRGYFRGFRSSSLRRGFGLLLRSCFHPLPLRPHIATVALLLPIAAGHFQPSPRQQVAQPRYSSPLPALAGASSLNLRVVLNLQGNAYHCSHMGGSSRHWAFVHTLKDVSAKVCSAEKRHLVASQLKIVLP